MRADSLSREAQDPARRGGFEPNALLTVTLLTFVAAFVLALMMAAPASATDPRDANSLTVGPPTPLRLPQVSGEMDAKKLGKVLDLQKEEQRWLSEQTRYSSFLERKQVYRLDEVRLHLQRFSAFPGMDLEDDRRSHDRVQGILKDITRRVGQDYLEQRLGLEDIEIRFRNRMRSWVDRDEDEDAETPLVARSAFAGGEPLDDEGGVSFSFSPQVKVSDDPGLGMKFRVRGVNDFLGKCSLRFDHRFASGRQRLQFAYQGGQSSYFSVELGDDTRRVDLQDREQSLWHDRDEGRGRYVGLFYRAHF